MTRNLQTTRGQQQLSRTRLTRGRRGSSVLEASLVLPILISLIFPAMEFGNFFYIKHTFQGAAREGARAAIVYDADSAKVKTAVDYAMSAAGIATNGTKYTITIYDATNIASPSQLWSSSGGGTYTTGTVASGTPVMVQCSGTWGNLAWKMGFSMISQSRTIVGKSVMRKEG